MKSRFLLFTAIAVLVVSACRKEEKCPMPQGPFDGRDQFVGNYLVYDTNGTYLYAMEIFKASGTSGIDSLYVVNWGDRFDMYIQHDNGNTGPFLNIIPPSPSYDHSGNRWAFFAQSDPIFQTNRLLNDTLRMSYMINNIAYYAQDGVPFFEWSYREYGVKQ